MHTETAGLAELQIDVQTWQSICHEASKRYVNWKQPGLKITRLRLLSDPGLPYWDVSYCIGEVNGKLCTVTLPFPQIPKRNVKGFIIAEAKRDGVYAKGIGILDCISKLW